jgi:UDP-N-acetylglucosamine:LPS N-acetylglucosamine transferase
LLSLGLVSALPVPLPAGVEGVTPARFRATLGRATVAIVAGGTTLYEACALGTPVVAVPVVAGQVATVRRFARAGLAVAPWPRATGVGSDAWGRASSAAALQLLADAPRRAALARRGRATFDGHGTTRVADAIVRLLETPPRHAETRRTTRG